MNNGNTIQAREGKRTLATPHSRAWGGKARFILQDALGKEILNNALLFIDEKEYLKLPNLANGLYTYKIKYTDEIFTGKLNILI